MEAVVDSDGESRSGFNWRVFILQEQQLNSHSSAVRKLLPDEGLIAGSMRNMVFGLIIK